jgi:Flp pilus assembly protein TadD
LADAIGGDDAPGFVGATASRLITSSVAEIYRATALANAGRNEEALEVAQATYDADRTDVSAALLVGRLSLRLGDGAAARAIYQQILTRSSDNLQALNGLGIAEVISGTLPAAEATFRRAVTLSTADGGSRSNLALTLALEGKINEAIPMLEAEMRQDAPSDRDRSNLALAYAAAGQADKAADLLTPRMTVKEANRFINAYAPLGAPRAAQTVASAVQARPSFPLADTINPAKILA